MRFNIFDSVATTPEGLQSYQGDYNIITRSFFSVDAGNTVITFAQWQSATGGEQHSLNVAADLLFVNPLGFDFHLLNSSPAQHFGPIFQTPLLNVEGIPRNNTSGVNAGAY